MTSKKERPGYDVEIVRRATVDEMYNFYELKAIIDPTKIDAVTVIRDIEKIVTFARELTAPKEPEPPSVPKETLKRIRTHLVKTQESQSTEDTKIADLKAGDKKVNISVSVVEVGEVNEFKKAGRADGRFCKVDVEDETGKIKLTLFDEQIDLIKDIKENAWLTLENAYVKEWQDKLELVMSKWGNMEVVYNG